MKWEYSSVSRDIIENLSNQTELDEYIVRILYNRGLDSADVIRGFINVDQELYNPFLMKDMDKAVARIELALERKEKIAVFGDYDADGITATVLVYSFLKSLNADVIFDLPERTDGGYGMNKNTVDRFATRGVQLVITVDTGITSSDEIELFHQLGIDVVVTDHHQPGDTIPAAYAVVDPWRKDCTYPFKYLAGVGVAFKLLCAISDNRANVHLFNSFCDLIAIGAIADLVPVIGENRLFITAGIKKIRSNPCEGIEALISCTNNKYNRSIDYSFISYVLAPRINAAGRVSSPKKAFELLMCQNGAKSLGLAQLLCEDNAYRKELENNIYIKAVTEIEADESFMEDRILVLSGENWHQGVIGIVAAKLVEKYKKPIVLLTNDGVTAKGSGRSSVGFNIYEAISTCKDLLNEFGGHGYAVGLQLDAELVGEFRYRLNHNIKNMTIPEKKLNIDIVSKVDMFDIRFVRSLSVLEPHGPCNEQPVFVIKDLRVAKINSVGNGKHLRITLSNATGEICFMKFGCQINEFAYHIGDIINIAFNVRINIWNNIENVMVSVIDIHPADFYIESDSSLLLYELGSVPNDMLPTRNDMSVLYSFITQKKVTCFDFYILAAHLKRITGNFNVAKLHIACDVFNELGIISMTIMETTARIKLNRLTEKADLAAAPTSLRLRLFRD